MPPQIPLIAHLAALAPLAPVAVLLWFGVRSPAQRWLLVACLLSVAIDAVSLFFALQRINNHWIPAVSTPFFGAAILMTLAWGQRGELARHAVIVAAALLLVVTLGITLLAEDLGNFSRFASPLRSVLVFVVALWTVVWQSLGVVEDSLLRSGWFWIPIGFALYSGVSALYFPLASVFATAEPSFVNAVLDLKSALVIVSFLLVAWGALCLSRQSNSGRSSWWSS